MRYDIAIIGTGPAGLSAAINAKINFRCHPCHFSHFEKDPEASPL